MNQAKNFFGRVEIHLLLLASALDGSEWSVNAQARPLDSVQKTFIFVSSGSRILNSWSSKPIA